MVQLAVEQQDRRRSRRDSVLKRAQIVSGGVLHDCIVLDSSAAGARLRCGTPLPLPPQVELRYAGGAAVPAVVRWCRGTDVGVEFVQEGRRLRRDTAERAWSAYEALRDGQLDKAVRLLRAEGFFDDETLREAVAAAEAARQRLEDAIRAVAQSGASR